MVKLIIQLHVAVNKNLINNRGLNMVEIMDETRAMDYEELCSQIKTLKHNYKFVQCFPIGKSVQGRAISTLLIGSGTSSILYVGGHHALEYLTSMVLMKFARDLCEHMSEGEKMCGFNVARILSRQSIYIVPMLNPDGVEIHLKGASSAGALKDKIKRISGGDFSNWQANVRGVDLNHNYNAGWAALRQMEDDAGIKGPSPRQFGGYRPESEPETHALCNLCRRMLFTRAYAFHSQGEEIYWEYGDRTPKNSYEMAHALANSCGYTVSQPFGLASHGGFKDWFISVFSRPGFTVEIGKGKNPLPPSELEPVYEKLKNLLLLGLTI
jgi:g-D-glutamyl-meso-diaminopimelate peptidase